MAKKEILTPRPIRGDGTRYTVVGVYEDNGQRWCDVFVAKSPADAEAKALRVYEGLVAAVFRGELTPVDEDPTLT